MSEQLSPDTFVLPGTTVFHKYDRVAPSRTRPVTLFFTPCGRRFTHRTPIRVKYAQRYFVSCRKCWPSGVHID